MPTYKIRKNGQVYSKTAPTEREAVEAVEAHVAEQTSRLDVADAQLDAINGPAAESGPDTKIEKTFGGWMDAVGSMISGAGGSLVGGTYGFGKGMLRAVGDGTYGSAEGVGTIRETMDEVTDQFSRDVYTDEGRAAMQSVADVMEPLTRSDQLGPLQALAGVGPQASFPGALSRRAAAATVGDVKDAAAATAGAALSPVTVPYRAARNAVGRFGEPEVSPRSIGSSEVDLARQRRDVAADLPVPFEGDSQLTRGQLTRDNDQLRFESEAAKRDGIGVPINQRRQNQQQNMHNNFNAIGASIDGPVFGDDAAQGASVRAAVDDYRDQRKKQKDAAYKVAREAGETNAIIPGVDRLKETFQQMYIDEGIVPKNRAMFTEAQRLRIIDADGNLLPTTVEMLEQYRKFANRGYNLADPTEARQRRFLINAIDSTLDATDAGPAYRQARATARDYYDEFDNSPLASGIGSNKRGTNVEKVPDEKVASKVLSSSIQEIDQLRGTLNATPEGIAQWRGIQGAMLDNIRGKAFGTQTDSNGTPLIQAATFKRYVQGLDQSGKLEAVLGPDNAQNIRNLVEVADAIATTPPGTVNHSGTSAMIMNHIMGMTNPKNMLIRGLYDHVKTTAQVGKSLDGDGLLTEGMK
jgi:hypothetical protein